MNKAIALLASLLPAAAWAHPGHHGIGLFHHLNDLLPIVAVVILVAGIMIWKKRH
ncbi:hypothetical protein [Shewanella colwelliana]|uniref:Peptidase M23 n=1 Tax=Shewanella colwelliana TaxID=23 RepID=A0ABQ4NXW1_SHECO|nr:hypothetical protein [Shewanella colwelliana]MCZ4337008.1 hypothetical protein [Shewanella colwelliana]MDX1280351.1 hypothetical protein [Shewanella colwelliana]GIU23106.1 hypothetical protein TUM4644_16190 [Shewanella colwelliana]GIU39565.1 hypothetical protein TUM3794_14860 [Shewanella colwelliana]